MSFRNHMTHRIRTVSRSTFADLSAYRSYVGNTPLTRIKQHFRLDHSIATLYTAFSLMKIPVDPIKLAKYYCQSCKDKITVFFPFYGLPHSVRCLGCNVSMRRLWICSVPFYYPRIEDFFFNGYQLVSVSSAEFESDVVPHLSVWKKSYPCFQQDKKDTNHIIHSYSNGKPRFFCGNTIEGNASARIVSGISSKIQLENVCQTCMHELISVWRRGEAIAAVNLFSIPNRLEKAIKLFFDVKHLGSINSACAKNDTSRRTYYRMKQQYLTEFNIIFGVKSS